MPADSSRPARPPLDREADDIELVALSGPALRQANGLAGLAHLHARTHDASSALPAKTDAPRQRPADWLAVKLRRECVDLSVSVIARPRGDAGADPSSWLGFALAGLPPSLRGTARMSGMGVVPMARGRGLARRMLARLEAHLAARAATLRCLSEPRREAMYRHLGFTVQRRIATLAASGTGDATSLQPDGPPPSAGAFAICGWLPETWSRSPDDRRRVWVEPVSEGELAVEVTSAGSARTRAWLTWEGPALLVHGLEVGEDGAAGPRGSLARAARALAALRAAVHPRTSLLVYGWPDDPDALAPLAGQGWTVLQRGAVMSRAVATDERSRHAPNARA